MIETKTIEHSGHTWEVSQLGDDSYSVLCLDPDFGDDNTDYTDWPSDELVSEWIGLPVAFFDGGDNPDYPESIYYAEKDGE